MKSEIIRRSSKLAIVLVIATASVALAMLPLVELGREIERDDLTTVGPYATTLKAENLQVSGSASVGGQLTVGSCVGCGGLSGLTTNKVMKASSATSATDSSISDDGATAVSTALPLVSTSTNAAALSALNGGWSAAMQNVGFGTLASALPAAPTVTDSWDPWSGGTRTHLVRVVTNQQGSILGSLKGGAVGDVVVLENHGDGSGAYGAGDLRIIFRSAGSGGPPVADHIYMPDLKDIVIPYTGAIVLYYDATNVGWIPIGASTGGRFVSLDAAELKISHPLTPSALGTGNTNDFDPSGGQWSKGQAESTWLRLNANAAGSTLTGLVPYANAGPGGAAAAYQGPVRIISNAGGPLTLTNEDTNSAAANRFNLPAGSITIPPNGVIALIYDQQGGGVLNQARWRVLSTGGAISKLTLYQAITDTSMAATVNDYNPTGFSQIARLRLAPSGGSTNLTGMVAQEDGAIRILTSYGAGLTLVHQSASSAVANRFYLPGTANYALNVGGSAICVYDATFGAWFLLGKAN